MPGEIEHESIFSKLREALKKGFRAIFHPVEMLTYRMLGGKELYQNVVREEFKLGAEEDAAKREAAQQMSYVKKEGTRVMCPLGDKAYVEGVVTGAQMKNVDGQNRAYLTVAMPDGSRSDILASTVTTEKQINKLNKKLDDKQKFEVITLNDYEESPQVKRRYTTLNKQAQRSNPVEGQNNDVVSTDDNKGKEGQTQEAKPTEKDDKTAESSQNSTETAIKKNDKRKSNGIQTQEDKPESANTQSKSEVNKKGNRRDKDNDNKGSQNKPTKDIEINGFKKGDEVYDQKSGTYGVITTITPMGFATIKPNFGDEIMAEVGNLTSDTSMSIIDNENEIVVGSAEAVVKGAIADNSNEKPKNLIDSRENIEQGSIVIVNKSSNFRKPVLVECTVTKINANGSLVLEPNVKNQNLGGTFTIPRNKTYGISEILKDDAIYDAITNAKGISPNCKDEIYASNMVDLNDVTCDDPGVIAEPESLETQIHDAEAAVGDVGDKTPTDLDKNNGEIDLGD